MNVYLQRIIQISIHILVIDLFPLISAGSNYHGDEGGHVILTFHHGQSRDCMFLLSFDNTPFNNNGSELSSESYPPSKHLRTTTKAIASDRSLTVSLRINSLIATDSGHYTCLFNCHNQVLSRRIRLQVHFPPQAAVCAWTDLNIPIQNSSSKRLSALQCTAQRGSPEGSVSCYSKSEHGSQAYSPSKVDIVGDHINARFWLKRNSFVKCCSQNSHFQKQYRYCNDFSQRHQKVHPTVQDQNIDCTDTLLGCTTEAVSKLSHDTPASAASLSTPDYTVIGLFIIFTFSSI